METQKIISKIIRWAFYGFAAWCLFSPELSYAITAEYKCTGEMCNLCVNMPKKTVCSEKYAEDSEAFDKAKQLSKFINDGLIVAGPELKTGFKLDQFAQKYFNCEFMVKKAEQIRQATQNMCVTKTVKYQKTVMVPRTPASKPVKAVHKPKKSKYAEE